MVKGLHIILDIAGFLCVPAAIYATHTRSQVASLRHLAETTAEYVTRLQKRLGEALEEADTHKAALDVVNTQRAQALQKARDVVAKRKAARAEKDAAEDAERRDNTLKALPGLKLRPRDEVVAEVIRERTGV